VLVRDIVITDDLVRDDLIRAVTKLPLWRDGTKLRAWLFAILHNQYVNEIRRSMRSGSTVELSDVTLPSRSANCDKVVELRDLDRALGQLPADMRAVILLVGPEGMPYDAVPKVLGISTGTVRSRLSGGRAEFRRLMEAQADRPNLPITYLRRTEATPQTLGLSTA
jgi:RNA polymerase sigma-70 factor (ECF subfamily)